MSNALAEAPVPSAGEVKFEPRIERIEDAIDLYHVYLQDYLFRLTRNWHDAEDLLQRLWVYVLHFPDENRNLSLPFLRQKAFRLFLDHWRMNRRRGEVLTDEVPETPVGFFREVSFSEEGDIELQIKFWSEFPGIELSESQKQVLWLSCRYGMTYQEIEAKLGVPRSTIGDWIVLGKKRLEEYLNKQN